MINANKQNITPTLNMMRIITFAMIISSAMLGLVLNISGKWNIDSAKFQLLLQDVSIQMPLAFGVFVLVIRTILANFIFKSGISNLQKPAENKQILGIIFTMHIIKCALAEAAAIMGFMIAQLHGESSAYVILGGAALFALLREFPSPSNLEWRLELAQSIHAERPTK